MGAPELWETSNEVSSSATVGWIPTVSRRAVNVRPMRMAAAKPWVTSPALGPR